MTQKGQSALLLPAGSEFLFLIMSGARRIGVISRVFLAM